MMMMMMTLVERKYSHINNKTKSNAPDITNIQKLKAHKLFLPFMCGAEI